MALHQILQDHNLTYVIQGEVILITTPEGAEAFLKRKVYPVDDLVFPESTQQLPRDFGKQVTGKPSPEKEAADRGPKGGGEEQGTDKVMGFVGLAASTVRDGQRLGANTTSKGRAGMLHGKQSISINCRA